MIMDLLCVSTGKELVLIRNEGKKFEEDFKKSVPEDFYFYRLRDSGSSFNPTQETGLRFSWQNDYDCFIFYKDSFFPIELKSTQGTSMSIQFTKEEKGKMIKLSQINGLMKAQKHEGVYAGFLLNFRKTEHTYWLSIKDFYLFYKFTDKKTINEKDIQENNGILIPQVKKRVRYTYDVKRMIEMIKGKYNNG